MSDKMRWRYGDTNPVVASVAATTVIEIGDLLWQDTNNAKPAALLPDGGSKAANQAALVHNFLGVAMARSRPGETTLVRVATTGVFELDCPSETFELGDLVGVDAGGDHYPLLNQQGVKVAASRAGHRTGCQAAAGGHDQRAGRHPLDRHDRRRRRRRRLPAATSLQSPASAHNPSKEKIIVKRDQVP